MIIAGRDDLLRGCLRRQLPLAFLVMRCQVLLPLPVVVHIGVSGSSYVMDQAQRHPVAAHRERRMNL